ncbi:MAG: preprotein translocase subunit SecY [Deltaproteobacteria bacterium]|nr:preprotein translocase subunit SecY [Deltaproteobacteria bacterium]
MTAAFGNIAKVPELRQRVAFTLAMLAVYRLGIFVTTPGVDRALMQEIISQQAGTLFGMFNMFVGGALERASVFSLGVMPYISASIIIQILTVVIPTLERLSKEGEQGRRKINQYTRYGTILIAAVQGSLIATNLETQTFNGQAVVDHPGVFFKLVTVLSLTAGTAFIMWLGEQITERGIGNGMSMIIFSGIVADLIPSLYRTTQLMQQEVLQPITLLFLGGVVVIATGFVVFMERAQRRIPVQYSKRVVGRKQYAGQTTHLPLRVNTSGVIPPIFASSLLVFPATIAQFLPESRAVTSLTTALNPTEWSYNVLYVGLIVFFAFFYTAVTFNPVDVADNLKKYGGYIPGVRPGKQTAEYIERVLTRITTGGALYIATVCVLPNALLAQQNQLPFAFGGTALLIVVGVALDTVQQIEGHLITRNYEGFAGPNMRIRGRRAAMEQTP